MKKLVTLFTALASLWLTSACNQASNLSSDNNNDILIDPLGAPYQCPTTNLMVSSDSGSSELLVLELGETQESSPPQQNITELNTIDLGSEVVALESINDQIVVATQDQKVHLLELNDSGNLVSQRSFGSEGVVNQLSVALPLIVFQNQGEERIRVWDTSDLNMTSGGYLIESVGSLVDLKTYDDLFADTPTEARHIYAVLENQIRIYNFPDNSGSLLRTMNFTSNLLEVQLGQLREMETSSSDGSDAQSVSISRWPLLYVLSETGQIQSFKIEASGASESIDNFNVIGAESISTSGASSPYRNLIVETDSEVLKFISNEDTTGLVESDRLSNQSMSSDTLRFGEYVYRTQPNGDLQLLYSGNLVQEDLIDLGDQSFSKALETIEVIIVLDDNGGC